ncbi:MAG: 8-amino-7-oxononanoate synthase [Thermodesulfovibrionales bacterium]|nr:8-amino-7-oxononanoate synthase [Thermodesulfovibrionales bacterium]
MFKEEIEKLIQKKLLRVIKDRNAYREHFYKEDALDKSFPFDFKSKSLSHILIEGQKFVNFSSNDYLGLSHNQRVIEAVKEVIEIFGIGAGASRLLSGGTELHQELEKKVAKFKGTEAALIFNSGYTLNTSVIPAISDEKSVIFSDELNHASIIDGCRLSAAKKIIYRHTDMNHLSELIKKEEGRRKIVITDTVFSMDGDIAPLKDLYNICLENDAILYLDDAHGTGVLGNGRGALYHFGLNPTNWIIQMGTFSKALGSFGAFIAADKEIIKWLINKSRGLIFSTALPATIVAASIKALEIVESDFSLIDSLWENRQRLFNGLKKLGFNTLKSQTPIIPLVPPHLYSEDAVENVNILSEMLRKKHIYAPGIRPPTVKIPRIRFSVTAAHTSEEIDYLLKSLTELKLR